MVALRVLSRRIPKSTLLMCRRTSILSNYFHFQSPLRTQFQNNNNNKVSWPASLLKNHSTLCTASAFQNFGSEFPQPTKNETSHTENEYEKESSKASGDTEVPDLAKESGLANPNAPDHQIEISGSDSWDELSRDDLLKFFRERTKLIKNSYKAESIMSDFYCQVGREKDMEDYAIQYFVQDLLYVEKCLVRASAVFKESFSKIDATKDIAGAARLLKTLLKHFEMTDKHLAEVLKKFGLRKSDPVTMNDLFDPHRHKAVLQIPDGSKPLSTVDALLKIVI